GRGENDRRRLRARPCSLEHIQRAKGVDLEIEPWLHQAARDRNLRGEVVDMIDSRDCLGDDRLIAHIAAQDFETGIAAREPVEIALATGPCQRIENPYSCTTLEQMFRKIGSDEAGASCNENPRRIRRRA